MEDEWSAAEAQRMQTNSRLRVESRQAEKAAKAAEKALADARERIEQLEKALEDVALRTEEHDDDLYSATPQAARGGSSVASLGEGYGGVALGHSGSGGDGGGRLSGRDRILGFNSASPMPNAYDAWSVNPSPLSTADSRSRLSKGGRLAPSPGGVSSFDSPGDYVSPAKLTLDEVLSRRKQGAASASGHEGRSNKPKRFRPAKWIIRVVFGKPKPRE